MFVQNITMLELDRPNRDIPADFFVVFVTENTEKEKEPFLVLDRRYQSTKRSNS